jgi:ATP-binding cassette subfamily F protein 3
MLKNNPKIKSLPLENPLLILSKVSKSFGAREIFSGVDLKVDQKNRIAIVGSNGIGKSVLLKIIVGLIKQDEGNIQRNKNLRPGYLPQETNWKSLENKIIDEMKSADSKIFDLINKKEKYEFLISDIKRKDLKEKISKYGEIVEQYEINKGYQYENLAEDILKKFNFPETDWNRKVKSLSGGERTRLALAKITLLQPNILILDEPTNHLDLETIVWLENILAKWEMAIILVSHDRNFLDLVCDKTFELNKNGLEKYYCNYSEYLKEKAERFEKQKQSYKRQEKYLSEQQKFIDRFRYKATKAKAVQSRIKMIDKIEKAEKPEDNKKKIKINFDISENLPQKVLEIENLIVGEKKLPLAILGGLWEIEKNGKIGIIGSNGAGKSTLLKTLIGKRKVVEGKIKFSNQVKIGYYAQSHEDLDPQKNILEEVKSKTSAREEKIRNVLGSLLFSDKEAFKIISDLSGGERARVAIAELILNNSNMLFLDEPTNHLDLESKNVVADIFKNFQGPIVMVSHDRYVLNKICNIIWEIKNGEVKKYYGNYDDYISKQGFKILNYR